MCRLLTKRHFLLCGLLPQLEVEEIDFEKYKEARGLYIEDPWVRVKSIFSKDDYGNRHPELINAFVMMKLGLLVGAFYGGTLGSVKRTQDYLHANETKIFHNFKAAQKVFANESFLGFFNGAIRYAPKFGIFLGGFTLVSSCCALYRNKPSIIDSIVGGFGVGALFRFYCGFKGLISGGIVGSVLGTLHGVSLWGISKLTNKDQLELRYAQFAYSQYRAQLRNYKVLPKNEFDDSVEKSVGRHVIDSQDLLESEENQAKKNEFVKKPENK